MATPGEARARLADAQEIVLARWADVPALTRLELRTVAPDLVPALDALARADYALASARAAYARQVQETAAAVARELTGDVS